MSTIKFLQSLTLLGIIALVADSFSGEAHASPVQANLASCNDMMNSRPVNNAKKYPSSEWRIGKLRHRISVQNGYGVEGDRKSGRVVGYSPCNADAGTPVAVNRSNGEMVFIQCGNPFTGATEADIEFETVTVYQDRIVEKPVTVYQDRIVEKPVHVAQGCSHCNPYDTGAANSYGPRIEDPYVPYVQTAAYTATAVYGIERLRQPRRQYFDQSVPRVDGHGQNTGTGNTGGRTRDGHGGNSVVPPQPTTGPLDTHDRVLPAPRPLDGHGTNGF